MIYLFKCSAYILQTLFFFQVCELHFKKHDIINETSHRKEETGELLSAPLKITRVKDDALPTIFPNCPPYISSKNHRRESPKSKRRRIEGEGIRKAVLESRALDFEEKQRKNFSNLEELFQKVAFFDTKFWKVIEEDDCLTFCHIKRSPNHKIIMSLSIDTTLATTVYFCDSAVTTLGDFKVPTTVHNINEVKDVLDQLKECKLKYINKSESDRSILVLKFILSLLQTITDESLKFFDVVKFVSEQFTLITMKKFQYSNDLLIFASLLYNCSPQCYRLLRESGSLILPCYTTLRNLTASLNFNPATEQSEENFLTYIKTKIKCLGENDKTVILMLDEIHLKANFDYKGGCVVGPAFDSAQAATSAHVFMISSVRSKFKDVVHIVPTRSMDADHLFNFIKRVIIGLEEAGLKVICVITDNNAINSKAMRRFDSNKNQLSICYHHPVDKERPLFFMFDSVHILKCIRNNWIKLVEQLIKFPPFIGSSPDDTTTVLCAAFNIIRTLHALEADLLLKHSYRLSLKAINPSNLEKQNVKLVLQIFNEYLIQALLSKGEKCASLYSYKEVADIVQIITDWWTVMNVNSPNKGLRQKNELAMPLTTNENDATSKFLDNFLCWLDRWSDKKFENNRLSKETFKALQHTTHAMNEVRRYLCNELKMDFILTGL